MNLSIKRFWFLLNEIDRLRSEEDLRRLQLMGSVGSAENFTNAAEALRNRTDRVYIWAPKPVGMIVIDPETGLDRDFDRAALNEFKQKIAAQR